MVSELTILHLQSAAAALMGYDYFLSDSLKEKANVAAADIARTYQAQLDAKLSSQVGVFRSWMPRLFTGLFYSVLCSGLYVLIQALTRKEFGEGGPLVALIMLAPFAWYSRLAVKQLTDAFGNGVLPFTFPVLGRVITTFLLYSSKGAIAALGMLFLVASFACRYLNVYHP
jgi:hypothetical protein